MIKYVITLVVAAIVATGAFLAFKTSPSVQNPADDLAIFNKTKLPEKPWLEVIKPKVFKKSADKKQNIELKTGDELDAGDNLEVDHNGLGAVHFPDGSVLRVDSDTKFIINDARFETDQEKVFTKITLLGGRIWSKILALTTADSIWEVKTTNAVATVRGTAFGFAFVQGQSRILGSENTTTVKIIDPKTGELVKDAEVKLTADKFIEIRDEDIKKIIADPKLAQAKDAPAEILNLEWVKRYKAQDKEYNQKLDDLKRSSGLEDRELRDLFRENIYKEFEKSIKLEKPEDKNKLENNQPQNQPSKTPEKNNAISTKAAPAPLVVPVVPQKLEIITKISLEKVIEGDQIKFQAMATFKNGDTRDLTAEVIWQVIGPIGSISKAGVFEAKLNDSVAEFGEGSGAIVATWKNKNGGEEILGRTSIFKVNAKIEPAGPQEG